MIKQAELSKARVYEVPGKQNLQTSHALLPMNVMNDYIHSAMVDENFLIVAAHIDDSTWRKIISCKYVDFSKLIPRDKILEEEDGCVQMLMKNGQTFFVLVQETTAINSYIRWEQAFRVFSDIFTRAYPQKSGELIQCNHIIHTISHTYIWDNVYRYDKDFRLHISQYPQRSWGIILQQAWAMRLKDKIRYDAGGRNHNHSPGGGVHTNRGGSRDICKRHN